MCKVSKESMVPKGFRPAVLPVSFLPRPATAGTLLPALVSLHGFNGQHISLLFGKFAFNYETEDNWEKGVVHFHVSVEINFLWKDMPVTVFTEFCCPILMSSLKNIYIHVIKTLLSPFLPP